MVKKKAKRVSGVRIKKIRAREILDSRGNPTVEVDLFTAKGMFRAAVPSGASTGDHEALELRDGGKRYQGKGVSRAVRNIEKLSSKICARSFMKLSDFDAFLLKQDGSSDKRNLGANALLALSLAFARAAAAQREIALYRYLQLSFGEGKVKRAAKLPKPFFNVINGGRHSDNELFFQEFMIAPRASKFSKALQMGSEIYMELKRLLSKKYGGSATAVGDEGGFAPPISKPEHALDLLMKAISAAGYAGKVDLAMDVAASEFYKEKKFKGKVSGEYLAHRKFSAKILSGYYMKLLKKYPIISVEDPFDQNDFSSFAQLMEEIKKDKVLARRVQIVGDDLTVTNPERIEAAIREGSCNCLLLKVNQIGTLTEALEAARKAYGAGWNVMVSHRSGETEDPFIADLAVAIGSGQIKAGAPCRGERTAKYNQLLRIEEVLGGKR